MQTDLHENIGIMSSSIPCLCHSEKKICETVRSLEFPWLPSLGERRRRPSLQYDPSRPLLSLRPWPSLPSLWPGPSPRCFSLSVACMTSAFCSLTLTISFKITIEKRFVPPYVNICMILTGVITPQCNSFCDATTLDMH